MVGARHGGSSRGAPWAATIALLLAACGSSDAPVDSGGEPGDGAVDAGGVAAPEIPWLAAGVPPLVQTPCAAGWREVTDDTGVTTCDPFPEGGAAACPPGEAHFPGESGCTLVGPPCPADGLVADLPADRAVVHVLARATGGDGTRAAPYGTLTEFAWGGLGGGSIVAVGRGTYDAGVRLPTAVALWGACAGETILTAGAGDAVGVVTVVGRDTEIRGVRIGPAGRPGIWVDGASRSAVLEGVWVEGVTALGVEVRGGGSLEAHDLAVVGTLSRPGDLQFGRGLNIEGSGSADVARASFVRNREMAVVAAGAEASLMLADAVVRETLWEEDDGLTGFGLAALLGARVEIARTAVEESHQLGVYADDEGTVLSLSTTVIRDTLERELDGLLGRGLEVQGGATAHVSGAVIERNREVGVFASQAGTALLLLDTVVRDARGRATDDTGGMGAALQRGASVEASRIVIDSNRVVALLVEDPETVLTLTDALVQNTQGRGSDGYAGHGVTMHAGAQGVLTRVLLARNRDLGLFVTDEGTRLTGTDLVVRDTESQERDGQAGRALQVQSGAEAELERLLFERNRGIGVAVVAGAIVNLTDMIIQDTLPQACESDGRCPDRGFAVGVGSYGASTTVTRFALRRAALCGVQVAGTGGLDLARGEVVGSPIGACVQAEGYDVDRLTDQVVFLDNGVNLETTDLPVPDPAIPSTL